MNTDSEILVPSDAERQIIEILDKEGQLPGGEIFKQTKRITYKYIYTSLGRMAAKGYVTSVLKPDGEIKKNIHFYRLTDVGKRIARAWKAYTIAYRSPQQQK